MMVCAGVLLSLVWGWRTVMFQLSALYFTGAPRVVTIAAAQLIFLVMKYKWTSK